MADNQVDITEGAGKSIATRTIGGKDYQQIIIADRTGGEAAILDIATEDTAHTTGDTGIVAMAVRADAAAGLPDTDGDYTPLLVDSDGKLWANVGTVAITAAALPLPSGAATAAAQATLLTELQAKADAAEAQTVDGSAVTHPISAAALPLPTGAATQATLADVETNTDYGATTGGGTQAGALRVTLATDSSGVSGATDEGPGWTSSFGVSGAAFTSADASTAAAVTDAPTGGQKLVITDIIFSVDTAMQVDFEIETAGTIYFTQYCAANTTYQITPRSKLKLGTADKKLMVDTSVAGNISVTAFYYSEA